MRTRRGLDHLFGVSALFLLLGSCGGHGTPTGTLCPTPMTLTYDNFGKGFMQNYCLRCHSKNIIGSGRNGAPLDHNFDTITDIRPLAEHIDMYAGAGPNGTNTLMPENDPKPSDEERRKLATWLACGAP